MGYVGYEIKHGAEIEPVKENLQQEAWKAAGLASLRSRGGGLPRSKAIQVKQLEKIKIRCHDSHVIGLCVLVLLLSKL